MKFKHLLMSGLIAALAGFFVIGCNENPDDPGNGDDVDAPGNLRAVSLSATSVGLSWDASTTTGVTYTVTIKDGATEVTTTPDIATTTITASGLTEGKAYVFSVIAVDADDNESDPVTVTWAPAERYEEDADAGGIIRIYERSAPVGKGTGLVLDPAAGFGGPRNVSVAGTIQTNPDLANVQLIADVDVTGNTFTIGPAKANAFNDFTNYSLFPNNVQVSDNYVVTSGLDNWYMSGSLEGLFSNSNKQAFENIADQQANNQGIAFAVRIGTGTSGQSRYARVFVVPGTNGSLIQEDNDGDAFVELHVSFQEVTGVPYAKPN